MCWTELDVRGPHAGRNQGDVADLGEGIDADAAASFDPLVLLLGEHGAAAPPRACGRGGF
ncbi:hypothetical protein ERC79_07825 [Rhodococcus sp. ABRD24]|uniref:hypothetical protein n=1 Tax=Rhodococcus sp. ABRD24 TaxID=2507582 RepID=UPI00103C153C|nr:hypothetical protein [Rhodococcus sp. ABRD24]QBJ95889.1 hypothetical protein ERC79_07825 [Rhodococcus sp. ABRD24]